MRALPLIDTGPDTIGLYKARPHSVDALIEMGVRHYTRPVARLGTMLSKVLLRRRPAWPYLEEIAQLAELSERDEVFMMNLSFEWGCTVGLGPDPTGEGNRMLRTLDWPLDGLGEHLVVGRHTGPAGVYYSATWPGNVGVFTGMAPGRFSVAINQPPVPAKGLGFGLDWMMQKLAMLRSDGMPPSFLLRRVFETARDYDEAKAMLRTEPVCLPVFFSLSGAHAQDCCVIERLPRYQWTFEGPGECANHWRNGTMVGRARGFESPARFEAMKVRRIAWSDDFSWVTAPILNPDTRLAVIANAARGTFKVRGFEVSGPVTEVFALGPEGAKLSGEQRTTGGAGGRGRD